MDQSSPKMQHIWIIGGAAGCGKTSVAEHLSKTLDIPFIEGDTYHPKANVDKMAAGIPLTDDDRWDWLKALTVHCSEALSKGSPGVVLSCSALKRVYRDIFRTIPRSNPGISVHFIQLTAAIDVILDRVRKRHGHYMKGDMVKSQFDTLEGPAPDEHDVLVVDVSGDVHTVDTNVDKVVNDILETCGP